MKNKEDKNTMISGNRNIPNLNNLENIIIITPCTSKEEFNNLFTSNKLIRDYFRINSLRKIGRISFFTLTKDLISLEALKTSDQKIDNQNHISQNLKIKKGSIVYIEGKVGSNRRGDLILIISLIRLVEEGLPIVDSNYYQLTNTAEIRKNTIYRLNKIKETIVERSVIYENLRSLLRSNDYVETICPIISNEYGGANATSFKTTRKEREYYLSICPELYLKRYLVAGFSKVYSIHRSFRNEGFDSTHYPEFDMIELYEVGANARRMKDLFFKFITLVSSRYNISTTYRTEDYFADSSFTMEKYEEEINKNKGWLVVEGLPHTESPLCKERSVGISDQIEIYYDNLEIANIYTEETNPLLLKKSFEESKGDASSKEDFLRDFSHAIPPTGGMGFGLDRLIMILLKKQRIEDVLPFINPTF